MEVKLDKIIICEGTNDAWFIDETIKKNGGNSKIVEDFEEFQEIIRTLSRGKPVGDPNPTYFILPLNPDYKDEIYKIVAEQIPHLRPLVEKFRNIRSIIVVDKNGEDEGEIAKKLIEEMERFINERFKGYRPSLTSLGHGAVVEFKGNAIVYNLYAIPNSLEIEIFKKFKKIKKFNKYIKKITNPDRAIFIICGKFYNCEKEKLFRSSVELFQNEGWFKALINLISELKER